MSTTTACARRRRTAHAPLRVDRLAPDAHRRPVLALRGRLDVGTSSTLVAALAGLAAQGCRQVVLDGRHVTSLDATGIRTLLLGAESLGRDALVTLRAPSEALVVAIEELALHEVFDIE